MPRISSSDARRRGRPRSPEIDRAVLEVTLRHLADPGFGRMSLEAIAAEAGVGRAALYRRWADKAALATAALEHLRTSERSPRTGDTRRDLVAQLERVRRFYTQLGGMAMVGALLTEEERHPELLARFRERVVAPRREQLRAILLEGQARGDIRPDLDLDVAVAALVGTFYARYLSGDRFPPGWSDTVIETLWPSLAAAVD
ncbi:MAG TPA: TetR/AcrR family transcriptional regulator [Acidimicrobiia bacterium]|nr:TetR/AcrR family transcriptional regulator [Acidimicrobiia bacterium]